MSRVGGIGRALTWPLRRLRRVRVRLGARLALSLSVAALVPMLLVAVLASGVLDLRGNGGGASSYGDEMAQALMGERYVRGAQRGTPSANCAASWRATPSPTGCVARRR